MKKSAILRRQIDTWFFQEVPPHAIAVFRILFGIFLIVHWLRLFPHVSMLFSSDGIVLPLYERGLPDVILYLLSAPPPTIAWMLYLTALVCMICMTVGFELRVAGVILFVLYGYYWVLSFYGLGGTFDRLFLFVIPFVALGGADRTYSVAMWQKYGSWRAWEPVSVFAQRIIAIQVTATYLGAGWQKIWLPGWQGGEILFYSLSGDWATPFAYWIARLPIPMTVYGVGVFLLKIFECLIPYGLWSKKYQVPTFIGGAAFHTFITLIFGMWWFMALIATYIFFLEPEAVRRFCDKRLKTHPRR